MTALQRWVLAGALLQLMVTVGLPLAQWLLVFGAAVASLHVLLVTGVAGVLAGILGVASALSSARTLHWPAAHVVAAVTLASLLGGFNAQLFLDLAAQCRHGLQGAAPQLQQPPALVCAPGVWQLLLPYSGLLYTLLLAAPAVGSLLLLARAYQPAVMLDLEAPADRGRVLVKAQAGLTSDEDWPSTTPKGLKKQQQEQQPLETSPSARALDAAKPGAVASSLATARPLLPPEPVWTELLISGNSVLTQPWASPAPPRPSRTAAGLVAGLAASLDLGKR